MVNYHKSRPAGNFPKVRLFSVVAYSMSGASTAATGRIQTPKSPDVDDSTSCLGPQSQCPEDFSDLSKNIYIIFTERSSIFVDPTVIV